MGKTHEARSANGRLLRPQRLPQTPPRRIRETKPTGVYFNPETVNVNIFSLGAALMLGAVVSMTFWPARVGILKRTTLVDLK